MKGIIMKILGYITGTLLMFPILCIFIFLTICKDYIYSIIISTLTLYLILGFNGISCLLSISLSFILKSVGSYIDKKGLEVIDNSMKKRLASVKNSNESKNDSKIDDILGRMVGL